MKIGVGGRNFPIRLECVPRAVAFFEREDFVKVGEIRHGTTFCNNKDGYIPDNYFKDLQFMEKSEAFQSGEYLKRNTSLAPPTLNHPKLNHTKLNHTKLTQKNTIKIDS